MWDITIKELQENNPQLYFMISYDCKASSSWDIAVTFILTVLV